ncbi:MAG: hypothetical protein M0Z61_17545 [Nitrospiraceae bacterium]|nr:hypothetical protein [Nitrospiraceae bacterium]
MNDEAILFSASQKMADFLIPDAMEHLKDYDELYWDVPFPIRSANFQSPTNITGYVHIRGRQVAYKIKIKDIKDFSDEFFEKKFRIPKKPDSWIEDYKDKENGEFSKHKWKRTFIVTSIERFSCDTKNFRKSKDGLPVHPRILSSYVEVIPKKK